LRSGDPDPPEEFDAIPLAEQRTTDLNFDSHVVAFSFRECPTRALSDSNQVNEQATGECEHQGLQGVDWSSRICVQGRYLAGKRNVQAKLLSRRIRVGARNIWLHSRFHAIE
jgi:hypothetical protein